MIDSGSQSSACSRRFAPEYEADISEKAKLWDIQGNAITSYGKKIIDIEFQDEKESIPGQIKMDVSDVGKNVLSMGRLIRSGFDLHFTCNGHASWMKEVSTGRIIRLYED